jgi:hypothetical protein
MAISIIGLLLAVDLLTGCDTIERSKVTKEFDIYITDAPFGKYWVHETGKLSGHFIFFTGSISGRIDSDLKETYTIKFMDGGELHTVLLSSTDRRLHVHFTDDNMSMNLSVTCTDFDGYVNGSSSYEYANEKDDASRDFLKYINDPVYPLWRDNYYEDTTENGFLYDFNLYIPRPEICQLSNETIS